MTYPEQPTKTTISPYRPPRAPWKPSTFPYQQLGNTLKTTKALWTPTNHPEHPEHHPHHPINHSEHLPTTQNTLKTIHITLSTIRKHPTNHQCALQTISFKQSKMAPLWVACRLSLSAVLSLSVLTCFMLCLTQCASSVLFMIDSLF